MIVHGCILCLFFVYFALISSRLEDEVEENEKFQLIVDFFFLPVSLSFLSWVYSFAAILFVYLSSALLDTCHCLSICQCLSLPSCHVRVILRYLGYLGREFIQSFKCSKQSTSVERFYLFMRINSIKIHRVILR